MDDDDALTILKKLVAQLHREIEACDEALVDTLSELLRTRRLIARLLDQLKCSE